MKETVYMTLKVYHNGCTPLIYLADYLGFEPGDMVRMSFYKLGQPNDVQKLIKRVVSVGNGRGCYIDKRCGVCKGDIVVMRIEPFKEVPDDSRIETEKRFEEPFE